MSNPFVGEIRPFAGTFAPANWHLCDGSLLSISTYDTLYTLLGTNYGGDGNTTFGVPDLRGRVAIGQGTGSGLTTWFLGQMAGEEQHTLLPAEMPGHTHDVLVDSGTATSAQAAGKVPAAPVNGGKFYLPPNVGTQTVVYPDIHSLTVAGGNQAHDNVMPVTAITYIISLYGVFPESN